MGEGTEKRGWGEVPQQNFTFERQEDPLAFTPLHFCPLLQDEHLPRIQQHPPHCIISRLPEHTHSTYLKKLSSS